MPAAAGTDPVRRPLPRPHRDDVLLAAGGLAGGLVLWSLGIPTGIRSGHDPSAWALLPLAVMAGCELFRRIAQPWTLLVACGALAADIAAGSLLATVLMFTDVIYAAVLYGPERRYQRVIPASVICTAVATVTALALHPRPESLLVGVVGALISVVPAWTGLAIRRHQEAARVERLRAEQTALLAELDRRSAVTAERARMARELHDVVANHLSAVAIHSTAALSRDDPAATREALRVIRENSVQGLAEMRGLITVLRAGEDRTGRGTGPGGGAGGGHGTAGTTVAPRLDGLEALVEQARTGAAGSGLALVLDDSRPPGTRLPAPVELAAYRIVQESLTNVLKHASPGTATVTLRCAAGALVIEVRSPYAAPRRPRAPGSGAGLVGMEERAALLGGVFTAGPAPGGPEFPAGEGGGEDGREDGPVWRVRAELPAGGEKR
ncbi:sensor histidine kinase [Streptomyces zingiberis]|uniref:histidine kinase n=1 Tax=Streptomyces zingiberis TaxID=2053010 RepID=A0ABX1BWZ1_9ACTN|nr:histidine kinase [Streptomyces zingiberis]NJQ00798.1 two-component sensor histidine kinase [Streptomyces zingiberis]